MGRNPGVLWTPRLIATVAELTERRMSAPSIAVVLELYENFPVSCGQVKWAQRKSEVIKPRLRKNKIESTNQEYKEEKEKPVRFAHQPSPPPTV